MVDLEKIRAKSQIIEANLGRLEQLKGQPRERIPTYLAMVRFRNRLVHMYAEVDDGEAYRMLQMNLGDFRTFLGDLASLTAGERPSTEPLSA